MPLLLDTGILLRLFQRNDPHYSDIQTAIKVLWSRGEQLVITPQNTAEFWDIARRPSSDRGGYALSVQDTALRMTAFERICRVLPASAESFTEWNRIVDTHAMKGASVQDARLVAQMTLWHVDTILTLNAADYRLFPQIRVLSPTDVIASGP